MQSENDGQNAYKVGRNVQSSDVSIKEKNRLRKQKQRMNETEIQKQINKEKNVIRKRKRISMETESNSEKRLKIESARKKIKRSNETPEERTERLLKVSENMKKRRLKEKVDNEWPKPISKEIKKKCMIDFAKLMSKESLEQGTCSVCNRRDFEKSFTTMKFKEIKGNELLKCSQEVLNKYFGNDENELEKTNQNYENIVTKETNSKNLY